MRFVEYWARKTVPVPVMATLVSEGVVATANGTVVVVVFGTSSAPLTGSRSLTALSPHPAHRASNRTEKARSFREARCRWRGGMGAWDGVGYEGGRGMRGTGYEGGHGMRGTGNKRSTGYTSHK